MGVDVKALSRNIENALEDLDNDSRAVIVAAISENEALRKLLLEEKITPEDLVSHRDALDALVRLHQGRGSGVGDSPSSPLMKLGSPTGQSSFFSPTTRSSFADDYTSLYQCPNCGSSEAERSAYAVQAHDNFPDILKCKKCGNIWNSADV
ncbi:hypothetical protein AGDE_13230 [Angomonas deanei]|nr:hypothetical protein AGDE_13230 [Angomonas deanei]|eukprot:EPY22595.1 hypothetical protein AGDE_13230 [Angomonas deanei]